MKNCLTCQYEPSWEKFYDDLHDGKCEKIRILVWYGAPTHGIYDEWCDVSFCWRWKPWDGVTELPGRKRREWLYKINNEWLSKINKENGGA